MSVHENQEMPQNETHFFVQHYKQKHLNTPIWLDKKKKACIIIITLNLLVREVSL